MEKKISKILDNFDFERVHKAMIALEWNWYMGTCGEGIPSVGALKKAARELLSDAWMKKTTISSGGFFAGYDDGGLVLRFILDEWFSE